MSTDSQQHAKNPVGLRSAYEVQQDFAETYTLRSEIVWDLLGPDQPDILMKKLEYMYPDDRRIYTSKANLRKAKKHNAITKEIRTKLFKKIWEQRKYTNGALLYSIIYIIVTQELDIQKAKYSRNYTMHPIFRTRRCLNNSNSCSGCCMIFVDEMSRVYQNWNDFVKNNKLPIGTMIAPSRGCYTFASNKEVELEYSLTPAYTNQDIVKIDNIVSTASLVGQVAAMLHPVCGVLTIGTKTYEAIRDYKKMSDSIEHGATTQLNANLNLASNIINLTSSVVTFGAYMALPSGEGLSTTTGLSIQAINSAASLINCTKFIITTYDIFTRYFMDEELEFCDIITFGSSLILLTNCINNFVITSQIGKINGNTLRCFLQSKIKAGLTLISGEMIKYVGEDVEQFDIFRLFNDIPYKDVLRNLHTIYSNLSRYGFLETLSVLGVGVVEILPGLLVQVINNEIAEFDLKELSKQFGSKFVNRIGSTDNLIDVLNGMGIYFSSNIIQFFLNQTSLFIESIIDAIDSKQNIFVTTELILYKMFLYTIKNYKNYAFEFLNTKRDEIILGTTKYFESLNPKPMDEDANRNKCDICGGFYYIVNI